MGRKGRTPESPAARRVRRALEAPALPSEGPELPKYLPPEAEAEWARLVAELAELGALHRADRGILEVAARCYATWRKADREIEAEGAYVDTTEGGSKASPWLGVGRDARRDYLRALEALGLTPKARGSKPSGQVETPKDRLSIFLAEHSD